MAGKQIDALTSTRGFAALLIVIFHFGLERFPFVHMQSFFSKGNMGVSYFYVLSGFIMCMVYKQQQISYGDYMKRRIARITPVYYFAIIISLLPSLYDHFIKHIPLTKGYLGKVLLNLGFLQSYIPGNALTVNSPGWSLSVEMFFYLLFPLLIFLYRKDERRFVWIACGLYIVSQVTHLLMLPTDKGQSMAWHEFIFYHPVNHLNEFMMGMAGYYFYEKAIAGNTIRRLPSVLILAAIIAIIIYLPLSMHNGLLAPLYLLFIIAIAIQQRRFLKWKPLVYLGEISYGIYILQMPMYYYTGKLNGYVLHMQHNKFFGIYLIVLLLTSALCYHLVEKPLRKAINRL